MRLFRAPGAGRRRWVHLIAALITVAWLVPVVAQQMGPRVIVTASQVASAIASSPLGSALKQYAADIGRLGMFESGGNLGVYNGTCCTGVLQVNRGGLRKYCDCTPEQYARMSLQQQVDVWARLTNANADNRIIRGLMARGSFDGRPVDGAMVLSCIQIGPGNCARTLAAGTCATRAGADGNGKNFCDFAASIRGDHPGTVPTSPDTPRNPYPNADPSTGGTYWAPVSAEEAFANGAGATMAEVREAVSNLVATIVLLWAAWVCQAQYVLWRRRQISLMAVQANIVAASVLTMLILLFTLD